jgi:hypothetical protein
MSKIIKICKGPGCKAWNSEYMAKKFSNTQGSQGVCLVPCMEKCGGGVSVRIEGNGEVLKVRETDEVAHLIESSDSVLVATC